jgi:electron transport complex protein RnfG
MYYLKLGVILLIFCAVAAGVLAYVNGLTTPIISERKAKEAIETREALIPNSTFEEKTAADSSYKYFVALDKTTKEVNGYTFVASKNGYSGKVETMVGLDKDFKVIDVKIITQSETPGLGANCVKDSFKAMFKGLGVENLMVDKDDKDNGKIIAMAGATITSRAIANSVHEQILVLQKELGQNDGGGK